MTNAPAPTRSSGTITLSWGMVSIPLKIYAGTEKNSVGRKEYTLDEDGNPVPVGRVYSIRGTETIVSYADVFKAVERPTEGGDTEVVAVSDDDLKSVLPMKNGTGQVLCFVKQSAIFQGQYVLENLYQVRPDEGAERAFAILIAAMRKTSSLVVFKMVLRNKAKFVAMLPNGDMYDIVYDGDVRERLPMPEVEIAEAEIEMGIQIVERGLTTDRPDIVNDEDQALRRLITEKTLGLPTKTSGVTPQGQDLMADLRASLGA